MVNESNRPTLESIPGGREGEPQKRPKAMLSLGKKLFVGEFRTWKLIEPVPGQYLKHREVRDATPEEAHQLEKDFRSHLILEEVPEKK